MVRIESEQQSVPLPGGAVGGAVRVGSTVHRPAGPWSTAVHLLLEHLDRRGLDGVPRAYGFEMRDGRATEVLSYLHGDCASGYDPWPDWVYSEDLIGQVMAWTRRFHDAVRDFRPGELRWRAGNRVLAADEIICHHDIAPYNVIVDTSADDGVRLVGVIDWDTAGPGQPLEDLAHTAWNFLPPQAVARESADRVGQLLGLMVRRYGEFEPAELLAAIGPRMGRSARVIRDGADAGDPGMRNLVESGRLRVLEAKLRWWESFSRQVRAVL